ncbi:MAG: AAA family ATPase [Patescibacteria group bacterium]
MHFEFIIMYLKKLEISGFKSFANKTTLDFSFPPTGQKVITAIVGPNGSGKSNIADAIRWVMGEQSMKTLRGKKSEDIIFAGSGKKARLGSAQAMLFFDNSDRKIPLDFSEVTIARKTFRSGEAEYLINGSRVRLQDVIDILAKAGIGKESYSIVNQGMADAMLVATPLERRSIIEEAAGVKQYQIKKDRSGRKLESTRENLDRARDLAEEIKPHLRMLKRQAEKTVQGEEIAGKLKKKQTELFTYRWTNFKKESSSLNENKDELGRKMMNIQREVDKLTDEINQESAAQSGSTKLIELEKTQSELRSKLNEMERELVISEGRIEIEKEKQKNMEMLEEIRTTSVPVDLRYVRENLEEIRQDQENLVKKISQAEKIEDLQEIKEYATVIQQRLHDLKLDIEKGKKETRQVPEREVPAKIPADLSVIGELKGKTVKIRADIEIARGEIQSISAKINEEILLDRQKRQKFFEIERNLRVKQEELGKFKDQFNEAKIALTRVEVREEDLRAEVMKELKMNAEELKGPSEDIDRESLEKEISKLRLQMEQIGGIDPLVIEEYEETRKRYEFLTKESEDLEKAIGSLKEIIKEMDQKINEVFSATFEEINKEFTKYFRIIFGGGNASLKKIEVRKRSARGKEEAESEGEENMEGEENEKNEPDQEKGEIGIDIFASPPGKRINGLPMLSGGERTLTALALLFAIIYHSAPPFTVLDEVEATLDEANSKRFGRIIQELSNNTQFIIITHNRETMRQANFLYGVTMGEDGISKLLSIHLDQVGQGGKILK